MGKVLIIKGADFSANSIRKGVYEDVDLSGYPDQGKSISVDNGVVNITDVSTGFESYIIPVSSGESYIITGCGWTSVNNSYRPVLAMGSELLAKENILKDKIKISQTGTSGNAALFNEVAFVIPDSVTHIFVQGRNKSNATGFVTGYDLKLSKRVE